MDEVDHCIVDISDMSKAIVDGVKGAELYDVLHTQCNSQMKLERWRQAIAVASEMMRLSPRNFIVCICHPQHLAHCY